VTGARFLRGGWQLANAMRGPKARALETLLTNVSSSPCQALRLGVAPTRGMIASGTPELSIANYLRKWPRSVARDPAMRKSASTFAA